MLGHDDPGTGGVAPGWRRTAFLLAAICLGVAGHVAPSAWFNDVRPRGYVADAAWVLALALVVAVVAGLVGVVLGRSALHPTRWSAPARHAVGWVRRVTNADVVDPVPTPAAARRWLDSLGGWDDAWTWAEPLGRTEVAPTGHGVGGRGAGITGRPVRHRSCGGGCSLALRRPVRGCGPVASSWPTWSHWPR